MPFPYVINIFNRLYPSIEEDVYSSCGTSSLVMHIVKPQCIKTFFKFQKKGNCNFIQTFK